MFLLGKTYHPLYLFLSRSPTLKTAKKKKFFSYFAYFYGCYDVSKAQMNIVKSIVMLGLLVKFSRSA